MSAVVERARSVIEGSAWVSRSLAIELVGELERLHSWDGLMSLLDEYYPESTFPTEPDCDDRDAGPRIVSLIRHLSAERAEVERLRGFAAPAGGVIPLLDAGRGADAQRHRRRNEPRHGGGAVTAPQEFVKKPVRVQAMQVDGDLSIAAITGWMRGCGFDGSRVCGDERPFGIAIETLEGTMVANFGDWVIRGVHGEFYPCKPDIFADTYGPDTTVDSERAALIALCHAGVVPQDKWRNRDSAQAQQQLAGALALLSAGCDYTIRKGDGHWKISEKTIWLRITYRGFAYFEHDTLTTETFYVPTRECLDRAAGGDWYAY